MKLFKDHLISKITLSKITGGSGDPGYESNTSKCDGTWISNTRKTSDDYKDGDWFPAC